jgi:hypothetical protein
MDEWVDEVMSDRLDGGMSEWVREHVRKTLDKQ